MSWTDAHVHIWTQDSDRYPTARGMDVGSYEPNEFMPEQLFEHTKPSNVSRVILVHMGAYGTDNSIVTDAIERYPGVFRAVGLVDQHSKSVAEDMAGLLKKGVTGFRISGTPGDPENSLQSQSFDAMFEAAVKTDQAMCPLTHPDGLPDLVAMCRRHQDTKVVLDHMSRIGELKPIGDEHIATLCSLAKFPRVHVKISRLHSLGAKSPPHDELLPMIRRVVDSFGPERLMWGSDSPYQVVLETYEDSISVVRDKLDFLSAAETEQILTKTAEKVLFW